MYRNLYAGMGSWGAALLAFGVGRSLMPDPSILTAGTIIFGAAALGWVVGAAADSLAIISRKGVCL